MVAKPATHVSMSQRLVVEAECSDCGGTGVYCGFAEPKGTAVVCLGCDGTGCKKIFYKPFSGRRKKRGVQTVRLSGGRFIATGVGPSGGAITYQEFLDGKIPPKRV